MTEPSIFPVSYEQQRLWYVHDLAPDSRAYHVPAVLRLRGRPDLAAVRRALDGLVDRHEVLRTSIRATDDAPYQWIPVRARMPFEVLDGDLDTLEHRLASLAYRPFDLGTGPLIRASVIRLADADHVLLLCAHHMVVDARSLGVLLDEFRVGYDAAVHGIEVPLEAPALQYADYAVWQRGRPATDADQRVLAYWRASLPAGLTTFSVADRPPSGGPSAAPVGTVDRTVSGPLAAAVRRLAATTATTPMVVLISAWAAVLAARAGEPRPVLLVPVSGRSRPELATLVGFFVNTIPVRLDTSGDPTVTDLLARSHAICAEAYTHQDIPFERLVDAVRPARTAGRAPLSEVMFTFQEEAFAGDRLDLTGLTGEVVDLAPRHAKSELSLDIRPGRDGYRARLEYRTDRQDAATATDLLDGLIAVLARMADAPGARLGDLGLPPARRRSAPLDAPPTVLNGPPAPADPDDDRLAARIAALFADVLAVPAASVDPTADFFTLGGNSLLAMRVVARLRRVESLTIPTAALFTHPSAAALAGWIADAARAAPVESSADATIERITRPVVWTEDQPWTTPMSPAQQRLWFLHEFQPDATAYHVPAVVRVRGPFDVPALGRALNRLIARHEPLRTGFAADHGDFVQRVAPPLRLDVDDIDIDGGDLTPAVQRELSRPFDLTRAPLVRAAVIREAADTRVLVLTMHHIVADGWSTALIIRELAALYTQEASGRPAELPEVGLQYADYTAWQARRLTGDHLEALRAYWRSTLAGAPTVLELPTDRPRRPEATFVGRHLPFVLSDRQVTGLRRLAGRAGATPFMVLLAALGITLGRHAGQDRVLIGSPVANRDRPELDDVVGFFVNTVPLLVDSSGGVSVADLVERVREVCAGAYAHQELPFDTIVETVGARRDTARSPLFQVMLAAQDDVRAGLTLPGLDVEVIDHDAGIAKFDLTIVVEEHDREIGGIARYNSDLFDRSTVVRLIDHLLHVLTQMIDDPATAVADLRILTDAEHRRQVVAYNAATATYPLDVPLDALVDGWVERTPAAVALTGCLDCPPGTACDRPAGSLTYGELGAWATGLAGQLAALGTGPGDSVAVLLDRSAALIAAEYAILKLGAAFLPLDPSHPAGRNAGIVADAGCRAVVTASTFRELALDDRPVLLVDGVVDAVIEGAGPAAIDRAGTDPAYVVYTSGSTGRPKGVLIEQASIVNNLCWMQQEWPLGPDDRLLFKTVHTFDVAVKEVFWPLIAGAGVIIAHPGSHRDASEICAQIARHRASVVHLVPSMLAVALDIARADRIDLSSLRIVMSGAETLPAATHDDLLSTVPAVLLHMYGPTETAIAVTGWPCHEPLGRATLPLGRAMPNAALYVLDDRMRIVPEGSLGELYVGGRPVGRGYVARPAQTARVFVPDPFGGTPGGRLYRTGDIVRYRSDGLLEFHGRRDNQVKIRGLRIELGEVEQVLSTHPAITRAAVIVWPRHAAAVAPDRPLSLVAYVVARPGAEPAVTATEVRGFLRARLPGYLVPAHIVLLDALPTGPTGKVDHDRLPDPVVEPATVVAVGPDGPTRRRIAAIWCELLELPHIDARDTFFDLGGHSLLATRLITRVRAEFAVDIALRDFFAEPLIDALVSRIESATRTPTVPIPVLNRDAARRPAPRP